MIITIFIRNRQLYYTLWLYIQYFIFIYIQNDKMPILLRVFFSVFIFHSNFYSTFILLGFYTEYELCTLLWKLFSNKFLVFFFLYGIGSSSNFNEIHHFDWTTYLNMNSSFSLYILLKNYIRKKNTANLNIWLNWNEWQ